MSAYNLMMLSGDGSIGIEQDGAFYRMLSRFSNYWQRIDILTPRADGAAERVIHDNVHVHPARQHRVLQPLFIKRTGSRLLAERTYHLIVSHDFGFYYNGIGARWLSRGQNVPVVSEIHHIEGYPISVNMRERAWRFAARRYTPWANQYVAAFRTVNAREVPDFLRQCGVPDDKILVLPSLNVETDQFQPMDGVTPKYDVLFVGRLAANKGIERIIRAVAVAAEEYPHIQLGIRGDGPLRDEIEQLIHELNIQQNVQFIPRLNQLDNLVTLYNQAKMLVCASTVEGGPRVTVEAMACGVPVISTPVGIMPEIIDNGVNGYIVGHSAVEIASRITALLSDETARQRIGTAGRESARQYDAATLIENYARAYHRLIEGVALAKDM